MPDSILGVWTLQSFSMENLDTNERSAPFGSDPRGTLILHSDGRMVALLTPQRQPAATGPADRKLVAYSGRYRLEPPDRLVTSVDVASFDDWVGTDQVRTYRLDGDKLDIITPPGRMPQPDGGEVTVMGILSWTREAATHTEEPVRVSS